MANGKQGQLVVAVKSEAGLRVGLDASLRPTMAHRDVTPLVDLLRTENLGMRPLFGKTEERLRAMIAATPATPGPIGPDLSVFYHVDVPDDRLHEVAQRFREEDFVAYAYVEPRVGL